MPSAGEPYVPVKSGIELWHVYKGPFSPTSFNPFANGRFAVRTADPPRAMFYAGETSDCALWETVLRDVYPQARPPHAVELPPLAGYHIARVRLKRDVRILDLGRLGVRWIAGDDLKRRDRITALTTVPKYTATHKEAEQLLADFPRAAGLLWPSKQTGEDDAYLFYDPPLASDDFEPVESTPLESPSGMKLIDQALARADMYRLDSAALTAELESELPSELGNHDRSGRAAS
jgi:RES domain